ncbi:hypothetical protein P6709_03545 [Jeotgalibacillus sp. ET6]|uniref:hypothetical protein n=1 Tax=Jeotgalibacillus sp. ET6 TaxID=3037260 RepID=UPI002418A980|nr:hypothetical protein [Jeotgalibacillus sp. ET6]MDG5470809.1 hypothetical protein [Jeotgalibacillus sp. ET6]
MHTAALIVAGIVILLLVLSFFMKDRSKSNEQELEDLSMNLYQEISQLKKRIKVLEEELMVDTKFVPSKKAPSSPKTVQKKPINEIIVNQVLSLHKQGVSTDQIVTLSSLPKEEVQTIIQSRK